MVLGNAAIEARHLGARRAKWLSSTRPAFLSKFESRIIACAISEGIAVAVSAILAKLLYIDLVLGPGQALLPYLLPAPLLALTLYLLLKQAGHYEPRAFLEPAVGYGALWGALAISALIVLGILYIFKIAEGYSRGWFLTWFALSAAGLIGVRVTARRHIRRMASAGRLFRRVAIYGTQPYIAAVKAEIDAVDPALVVAGQYLAKPAAVTVGDAPIHGGLAELRTAIGLGAFDSVIIAMPAGERDRIQAAVNALSSYSTELLLCTDLDPHSVAIQGSRSFGPLRLSVINSVPHSQSNGLLKMLLDYAVAMASLIVLAPLLLAVAIAIKLDSPGPVFFRQRRYGHNNRVFRIFKFRTMAVTEDGPSVKQAERNDPRVTRVGRFLRRTSIDELPQIFNVLTGDMSIVGPRPHALAHDELFERQLDLFSRRRRVRPGMTGWAQVHGWRGETKTTEDVRRRMQHDLYYIDNWSIWLDIEIITRTAFVLFRGAY